MCVCVGGGIEGERERTSGLSQSVRVFFCFFLKRILFLVMGLVLQRRNGTEKEDIIIIIRTNIH